MTISSSTLLKYLVVLCALGLVIASAGFGSVFAYRVGIQHSELLAFLSVLMAIALEGVKPVAVSCAFNAFRSWDISKGVLLLSLGLLAIAYSLTSELTLMAMSRGDLTAKRQGVIDQTQWKQEAYKRAVKELSNIEPTRTIGELQSSISDIENKSGILINGKPCGGVYNGPVTKQYCPIRSSLLAELARAERRKQLESIIQQQVSSPKSNVSHVKQADPGSQALSIYLGVLGLNISVEIISQWLSLIQVLALEFGSALALVLVNSLGSGSKVVQQGRDSSSSPLKKLTKEATAHQLVKKLKTSGGSLSHSERDLAKLLGTSRATLRRAIGMLSNAGFLMVETCRNGTKLSLS